MVCGDWIQWMRDKSSNKDWFRPTELSVDELVLITEGVSFEPVPVRMTLPPASEGAAPARIKLIGVPRYGRILLQFYELWTRRYICFNISLLYEICRMHETLCIIPLLVGVPVSSRSLATRAPYSECEMCADYSRQEVLWIYLRLGDEEVDTVDQSINSYL